MERNLQLCITIPLLNAAGQKVSVSNIARASRGDVKSTSVERTGSAEAVIWSAICNFVLPFPG